MTFQLTVEILNRYRLCANKMEVALGFERPTRLDDALITLGQRECKVIAGGTDVFPAARQGQVPDGFLDVSRIEGLTDISIHDGVTRIGAAVTWSEIVAAELPAAFDGLKQAAREVGSLQIQNAGTIGGNLCNASPAADGVPPLLTLDAQIELASAKRGTRVLPLSRFLLGVRKTALAADELVTAVLIPSQPKNMGSAFEKLGSRRYMVISIAMTSANIVLDKDDCIAAASVAVGSCSTVAQRLPALETALIGQRLGDIDVTPAHIKDLSPIDDVRGTGAYRLDAVREQCRRAIIRAGTT